MDIAGIQKIVAAKFGVTVAQINGTGRCANIVLPRHVSMFLSWDDGARSYMEVARMHNRGDHTTIINARSRIEYLIEHDADLSETVDVLRLELNDAPVVRFVPAAAIGVAWAEPAGIFPQIVVGGA